MKAQHFVKLLALVALIIFVYFTAQRKHMGGGSMMRHHDHHCSFADESDLNIEE